MKAGKLLELLSTLDIDLEHVQAHADQNTIPLKAAMLDVIKTSTDAMHNGELLDTAKALGANNTVLAGIQDDRQSLLELITKTLRDQDDSVALAPRSELIAAEKKARDAEAGADNCKAAECREAV